ncbi:MAG: O-antigen polysaccharide polymerase Wzy [Bdellovibrionales bacterium]|jgi:oligosaccharide repeat unit polymerase
MRQIRNQGSTTFFYIVTFVAIILALTTFIIFDTNSGELMYSTSLLTVLYAGCLFLFWRRIAGSSFDPFTLFLLSMLLFLCGHQILYLLGLADVIGGILYSIVSPETTNMALLQIFAAFVCFGIGGGLKFKTAYSLRSPKEERDMLRDEAILRKVGWAIIVFSLIPVTLNVYHNIGRVMAGGYGAYMYRGGSFDATTSLMRNWGMFFLPGCLLLLSGCRKNKRQAFFAAAMICYYSLPFFFLGERSRAIMPLLASAWVWHKTIKPLPKSLLIFSGIFLLFFVFPIIRITRMSAGADRSDLSVYLAAFSGVDNPIVSILDEMGQSGLRIIAWVYDLVPNKHDFAYGESYWTALGVLVPHFSGAAEYNASSLSRWLVAIMEPQWAVQGGGYGFSFVAEAYYNYGWLGIFLISGLLGYILAALSIKTLLTENRISVAFMGCLSCIILFYPRAETRHILREIVWFCFLPCSIVLCFKKLSLGGREKPKRQALIGLRNKESPRD